MEKEIPGDIREFLVNMLYLSDEFGYGEEIPDGVLWDLYGRLNSRISDYLLGRLPTEKLAEYRQLTGGNVGQEQLDVYLMKNVPEYKDAMKKAYKDFYDSYLEEVREKRTG
jgi:hypothetical protein